MIKMLKREITLKKGLWELITKPGEYIVIHLPEELQDVAISVMQSNPDDEGPKTAPESTIGYAIPGKPVLFQSKYASSMLYVEYVHGTSESITIDVVIFKG